MTTKYDALEALEGKATKGPWEWSEGGEWISSPSHILLCPSNVPGGIDIPDGWGALLGAHSGTNEESEANAQLITAARNAVPTLIADVKALAEALGNRIDIAEECAFDEWLSRTTPSGDITDVQNQWKDSVEFFEFCERWKVEIAALARIQGEAG